MRSGEKEDFYDILNEVESKKNIKYFKTGLFDDTNIINYNSLLDYKELGNASFGSQGLNDCFLIISNNKELKIRSVPTGIGISNTRSFAKFTPKGYTIAAEKFDYFFGRVNSSPDNMRRSLQNLNDLKTMGLTTQSGLIRVINKAFSSGKELKNSPTPFGRMITKQVQVGDHALNVGFFYKGGNMNATPSVSTIIPKIKP